MAELHAGKVPGSRATARVDGYPVGGVRFDLIFSLLSGWFLFGLFLDGWAHNHGKVDNTFFTPWHAVLYSSVLAIAGYLSFNQTRNMLRGYAWLRSLPRGYLLSLIGVAIFFMGGGFDFAWHSAFGFEANIEALLSPAHLLLASGAFLFVTGPLRAGWMRSNAEERAGWRGLFPVMMGLLILMSLLTFFTQYSHPFSLAKNLAIPRSYLPSNTDYHDVSTIAAVLFYTTISMSIILFAMRRWTLPFGSLALILSANALLMHWMRYNTTLAHQIGMISGIIGSIITEALYRTLRPSALRPEALRFFAFLAPFLTFVTLFGLLLRTTGIWWSIHMWLGVCFLSGITGLFLSYLAVPPRTADTVNT